MKHAKDFDVFSMLFKPFAAQLAQVIIDFKHVKQKNAKHYSSHPPSEDQLNRKTNQILDQLYEKVETQMQDFEEGFEILSHELPLILSQKEREDIQIEFEKALTEMAVASPIVRRADESEEELNTTIQSSLKLSNFTLEKIYQVGYQFCQKGNYHAASQILTILAFLNSLNDRYWLALGIAKHKEKHYEEALHAYAISALLNPDHFEPRLYSIEAYCALNMLDDAQLELEVLLQEFSHHHKLTSSLQRLKRNINQKREQL